jgi:nicotinamidase/pyrazinamidase
VAKNIQLLIIDPQNSFSKVVGSGANAAQEQQTLHDGELCVPGAWDDMGRVGNLVTRLDDIIDDITVTLDSHDQLHIAHPMWYRHVQTGAEPAPFTVMRVEDVVRDPQTNKVTSGRIIGSVMDAGGNSQDVGEYRTVRASFRVHTLNYLADLAAGGRYPHVIWPFHCLIGTSGHNIVDPLRDALVAWERKNIARVNKVTKGSNMGVEHFSALRAEVVDPNDPYTDINTNLINTLMAGDEVLLTGEALSHCLANTVRDIANQFAQTDEFIKKCVLLTDASSNVPGFEKYGQSFIKEMTKRGMRSTTTVDYLA